MLLNANKCHSSPWLHQHHWDLRECCQQCVHPDNVGQGSGSGSECQVVRQWRRLPRDDVESLSLEIFNMSGHRPGLHDPALITGVLTE